MTKEMNNSDQLLDRWKNMLRKELGGKDLDGSDLWLGSDGFSTPPAPTYSEVSQLPLFGQNIASLRFNDRDNNWGSHAEIMVEDVRQANERALYALRCGADGLTFDLGHATVTDQDLAVLLTGIQLDILSIGFRNVRNPRRKQEAFFRLCTSSGLKKGGIKGGIWLEAPLSGPDAATFMEQLMPLLLNAEGCERFGSIGADCTAFHMLGANIPQQIGLSLALGHDVMLHLRENGVRWESMAQHFGFMFMVGPSFLPEVARTRLMRFLWARLLQEYGCSEKHARTYLHASTSLLHRATLDVPNNLLRANAQAMNAVIGGADALTVHPFRTDRDHDLALRMAINTQHLMRDEAGLHRQIDPMAGSLYLEHLTHNIGNAAWQIFKDMEAEGGYFKTLEKGRVRAMLETTAMAFRKESDSLSRIQVGVNKYPSPFKDTER
jgi:methylmalonyl-CoA mutase